MARFYIIIFLIRIKSKKKLYGNERLCLPCALMGVHQSGPLCTTNLLYWERCSDKNIENLEGIWLIVTIWKSKLLEQIKKDYLKAVVESVLLDGSFAWALYKWLENKLNGTYTRMIRAILDISTHPSKERLYGNLI